MNVYHITYAPKTKTANLHFHGCNFDCLGCIRKKTLYDVHLKTEPKKGIRYSSLDGVLKILSRVGARKVILMGGEPTVDPELPALTENFHDSDIYSVLLTNGHVLNEKLLKSVNEICLSIKAYSDKLHRKFTGKSNKNALKNFRKIYDSNVFLSSESIYIPDLIEVEEVKKIAHFISSIDPKIPYHIDAYIPINDVWRAPTPQEIKNAAKETRKYLKNVTYLFGNEKLKYEVFNVT